MSTTIELQLGTATIAVFILQSDENRHSLKVQFTYTISGRTWICEAFWMKWNQWLQRYTIGSETWLKLQHEIPDWAWSANHVFSESFALKLLFQNELEGKPLLVGTLIHEVGLILADQWRPATGLHNALRQTVRFVYALLYSI
jgi:hypothetical protein